MIIIPKIVMYVFNTFYTQYFSMLISIKLYKLHWLFYTNLRHILKKSRRDTHTNFQGV